MGGWLENEFLKKTPSPISGLESHLGTTEFGICQFAILGPNCNQSTIVICEAEPLVATWANLGPTHPA